LDRYSIVIEPGTFGSAPNTKFTSDDGYLGFPQDLIGRRRGFGCPGVSNAEVSNEWRYALFHLCFCMALCGKGNAIYTEVWTGSEGSRRLRFVEFLDN
jgi:hypothetical protein